MRSHFPLLIKKKHTHTRTHTHTHHTHILQLSHVRQVMSRHLHFYLKNFFSILFNFAKKSEYVYMTLYGLRNYCCLHFYFCFSYSLTPTPPLNACLMLHSKMTILQKCIFFCLKRWGSLDILNSFEIIVSTKQSKDNVFKHDLDCH